MMPEQTHWDALLAKLRNARIILEIRKNTLNAEIKAFEDLPNIVKLKQERQALSAEVEKIEKDIRDMALDAYHVNGVKNPHEKIEIKVFKTFKILSADVLREWVLKNLPAALKVDEKKIEKYALEIGPVEGTEQGAEARVQIASKL